jgi:PKD repeat protein
MRTQLGFVLRIVRRLMLAAAPTALMLVAGMSSPVVAATILSVQWTAGGHSAGADSAGQSAHMAVDASGNVTVVSGPGFHTALVVTSYTSTGVLRWQRTVAPPSGTMAANWVAAAPNGDVVVLGSTSNTQATYAITLVRYASDGTLLWRVDPPFSIFRSSVGRLVVDAAGSTYVTFNNQVAKYNAAGILLWTQTIPAGFTTSLALGPDGSDVVVTGNFWGSFNSVIGSFDAATGASRWVAAAAEGSNDAVVDSGRVYVTGQSYTGAGTPALAYFLTVIAYDRATGARLWRTDSRPGSTAIAVGQRIALAPDGSLVAIGYASSTGCIDWWTVAMETNGAVRWQASRDRSVLCYDEFPRSVFVLADGTTVVSGIGGPLVGPTPSGMSYLQGVTAGYNPDGTLLWEGFATLPIVWAAALPSGDVCATGGYDALITCFQVPGAANFQPVLTASPLSGTAPLTVNFTRSVTTDPNGPIISFVTLEYGDSAPGISGTLDFGDGTQTFTLDKISSHAYNTAGTYTATLTVSYSNNTRVSKTVTIAVSPSVTPAQPPLITASPVSGTVPLTVTLTSSAASNPPLISSYTVNYGDGARDQFILNAGDGAPSFNSSTSHTYTAAGTYIATLTVFYTNAVSASATVTVTVNPAVSQVMRSTAINLSATLQRSRVNVTGIVVVESSSGAAIPGAVVSTTWARPGSGAVTQTATTNSSGIARFSTSGGRGTYTLTVNNISKTGYSFDSANSVLSKSITK